ncbi:MAG: FAD:protein FMN transferase [Microthrixaceae bacterium]
MEDPGRGQAHHVIDPRSARPAGGPCVAASVLADEAWWAEVLATALLVGYGDGVSQAELEDLLGGAGALLTLGDGTQVALGARGWLAPVERRPGPDDEHRKVLA